mgnify:CR=1 FL=1
MLMFMVAAHHVIQMSSNLYVDIFVDTAWVRFLVFGLLQILNSAPEVPTFPQPSEVMTLFSTWSHFAWYLRQLIYVDA